MEPGSRPELAADLHGHVFPPALVPVLRGRIAHGSQCLCEIPDDLLTLLVTTVFFAGLEPHEGERNPVRVVFLGRSSLDLVMARPEGASAAAIYRWKVMRFATPRLFTIPELVKLAAVTTDDRLFTAIRISHEDRLVISGLAREGINLEGDPFLKIVAPRPGNLSFRNGRDRLLEYERGAILAGGENLVLSAGPLRRALEHSARLAGVEASVIPDYLDVIRALVREMAAHGRGGILVVSPEDEPGIEESAPYRMVVDSSLASILRLAHLVSRSSTAERPVAARSPESPPGPMLQDAFRSEVERIVQGLGALTAIDGATVLNHGLALSAFGVILPVEGDLRVVEACDPAASSLHPIDLGHRGTRHRAGAICAARNPGSAVFVASTDGQVNAFLREDHHDLVMMWRLGLLELRPGRSPPAS